MGLNPVRSVFINEIQVFHLKRRGLSDGKKTRTDGIQFMRCNKHKTVRRRRHGSTNHESADVAI